MLIPHLKFNGNCKEAYDFYLKVFHTFERGLRPYEDYVPEGLKVVPPNLSEWILLGELEICGELFYLSDVVEPVVEGSNLCLELRIETKEKAERIFNGLKDGAHVIQPLVEIDGDEYNAKLIDKFGIHWEIEVTG